MCAAKESTFILLLFYCIMVSKGSPNDYDGQVIPLYTFLLPLATARYNI